MSLQQKLIEKYEQELEQKWNTDGSLKMKNWQQYVWPTNEQLNDILIRTIQHGHQLAATDSDFGKLWT